MESGANLDARELEGRGRAALPWPSHLWGSGVVGRIRPGEVRPQVAPLRSHPAFWPVRPAPQGRSPTRPKPGRGF